MATTTKLENLIVNEINNSTNISSENINATNINTQTINTTGSLNVEGTLTIPNSPTNPSEATLTDSYRTRETANGEYEVVNGSETIVTKIQGKTSGGVNLIPFPYYIYDTATRNGVTYTVREDGGIELKGVCTATFGWRVINKPYDFLAINESYTISLLIKGSGNPKNIYLNLVPGTGGTFTGVANTINGSGTFVLTATSTTGGYADLIFLKSDEQIDCVVYPMLNKGSTALPYERYKKGMPNSYFKGIISQSKNLLNTLSENTTNTTRIQFEEGKVSLENPGTGSTNFVLYSKIYPAGTYTFSAESLSYTEYKIIFAIDTQISGTVYNAYYTGVVGQNCYYKIVSNMDKYYTFTAEADFRIGVIMSQPDDGNKTCITDKIQLVSGTSRDEYVPFREDTSFMYDEIFELGNWDYILPQEGKVHQSTIVSKVSSTAVTIYDKNTTGSTVIDFYQVNLNNGMPFYKELGDAYNFITKNIESGHPDFGRAIGVYWLNTNLCFWSRKEVNYWDTKEDFINWLDANNIWVAYPSTETITNISPKSPFYTVYPDGSETVDSNNYNNDITPTITQIYSIHENPTEAANKAYVNNGLATKLDKRGGTITGNLIVEGVTDTNLGAIVCKKGDTAYGLSYNEETGAYQLGQGTVDEEGDFTYNSMEGFPIALRNDSTGFVDGELVMWNAEYNVFVGTGITLDRLLEALDRIGV